MSNLNLKQLRVFLAVVDARSFTKGAQKLFLSQSTVSSHIKALEDELGVILFQREAKKQVRLTQDGKRLVSHARDIIARCDSIEQSISGYSERELVIGASTVPAQSTVPLLVRSFLRDHPDARFYIPTGDSRQILEMVINNEVQIGFVGTQNERQALVFEPIQEDHLVVITPNTPEYRQLQHKGICGRELLDRPLILREEGSGTQAMVDFYLRRSHVGDETIKLLVRTSDPDCIKELVALGTGISILSASSVKEQMDSGKLLAFELEEPPIVRKFYMVYRKAGVFSDYGKRFMEKVRGSLR